MFSLLSLALGAGYAYLSASVSRAASLIYPWVTNDWGAGAQPRIIGVFRRARLAKEVLRKHLPRRVWWRVIIQTVPIISLMPVRSCYRRLSGEERIDGSKQHRSITTTPAPAAATLHLGDVLRGRRGGEEHWPQNLFAQVPETGIVFSDLVIFTELPNGSLCNIHIGFSVD